MIPVTELRQGNWFKEGIFQQFDFRNDDGWHTDNFDPIPITPEILEKCGFVREYEEYKKEAVIIDIPMGNRKNLEYYRNNWNCIEILYVHQLQNLYFALTGEELQIDL